MQKIATTLDQAIDAYLAGRATRHAATTVRNDEIVLRRFAAWYGNVQIRHMRPERVEEWFNSLRRPHTTRDKVSRPPITAVTFNYYSTRLRGLFDWCTRRGLLKTDLMAEIQPLPVRRKKRLQPPPSVLVDLPNHTTNARDRMLVALLASTGFRRGTALALKVGDIDLDSGWIFAQITKSRTEDEFPISSDPEPEIRRWFRAYAKELRRPLTGDEVLLPRRVGHVWRYVEQEDGSKIRSHDPGTWDATTAMTHPERVVQATLRSAGLEIKAGEGCHTLRRAVARAIFDSLQHQGHDHAIRMTGAMLHHQNAATTEIYLGLSAEIERRNTLVRGKPLLSAMVQTDDAEVVPIRR